MKVNILGPNLMDPDGFTFHVHAADCADITRNRLYRGLSRHELQWVTEVESTQDLIEQVYSDQMDENEEGSFYATWQAYVGEFHVFPCVGELPDPVPSVEDADETRRLADAGDPGAQEALYGAARARLAALLADKVAEAVMSGANLDEAVVAVRQLWLEAAS